MKNKDLTPIWKALADPTRRYILDLLRETPHTTGDLCDNFEDLSRYAVMKHLTVLEEAGLILVRRKGRQRFNQLNAVPLQHIYERWLRPYEAQWSHSLTNLKTLSERNKMLAEQNTTNSLVHNIEQEIIVNADVSTVYESLLDINGWWAHRMSKNPDSLRLEAKVGGRFWETRDGSEDNGALWGTVTSIEPNDHIQLSGSIGMQGAILGNVVLCTIPQEDNSTKITLSHQFVGEVPERYFKGYDDGWKLHLEWIKKMAETGDRLPAKSNDE